MLNLNNRKFKMIYAKYDPRTGQSTVAVDTDLGEIWADAFLHPQDKEFESKYIGCEIARLRAVNQYWLQLKNVKRNELKILTDFLKEIQGVKNFNSDELAVKRLYKKINRVKKEIEYITEARWKIKTHIKDLSDKSAAIKTKMRNLADENKDKED